MRKTSFALILAILSVLFIPSLSFGATKIDDLIVDTIDELDAQRQCSTYLYNAAEKHYEALGFNDEEAAKAASYIHDARASILAEKVINLMEDSFASEFWRLQKIGDQYCAFDHCLPKREYWEASFYIQERFLEEIINETVPCQNTYYGVCTAMTNPEGWSSKAYTLYRNKNCKLLLRSSD